MNRKIARPSLKMAGLTALLCCLSLAQQSAKPDLTTIVQEMEKAQSEFRPQTPYQVIREYRLFGAKSSSANAEVVAQIDFRAPTRKDYSIQKWSGSTRGRQVVQRVLDHETENNGNQSRTALTSDNYDFFLVAETLFNGRPCYVLGLKPKRKEKDLILGQAWVDKRSFFILHIEGEAAKVPSWWLKSVRVKLSFGDLSGTWLQTSMEAVADVRLLGSHTLTSRILDYQSADMSASTMPAPTRRQGDQGFWNGTSFDVMNNSPNNGGAGGGTAGTWNGDSFSGRSQLTPGAVSAYTNAASARNKGSGRRPE